MMPTFVTRKANPELTRTQKATLLALVRREARTLGYGSKYSEENVAFWPQRLKDLRTIARKLMTEDPL